MPRIRDLLLRLSLLLLVLPCPGFGHVGPLGPAVEVPVRQFGQLTTDPGIECIASDATLQLGLGVYSVVTGTRIATFPSPFHGIGTTFILRDFNGDGFDDALSLLILDNPPFDATVGLTRHGVSGMTRVFPDIVFTNEPVLEFVETMHLNATEPQAIVLAGRGVHIVSESGELLYTSEGDPAYPTNSGVPTVTIDDFNGDGFDDVAAVFPGAPAFILIGDSSPNVGVDDPKVVARSMLLSIRPNPAMGLARIAFDLPAASRVQLRIYDTSGRLMNRLADGPMVGGRHDVAWDGRDASGRRVPGGVYFYELEVNGMKEAKRMVRLR